MAGMVLIMPGLFVSMIVAGNVHDFSMAVAAPANVLFYSAIGWLATRILNRRESSASNES
jgi:hypothetical protein